MKNIKLVIFDLDGTLVDAYPAIVSSFNFVMRRLKIPPSSREVIRRAVGRGDENLLAPFVGRKELKKALRIYRRHHSRALLKGCRLAPQAGPLLDYLKGRGYRLGIASNRPTRFSRIIIRRLKIGKYFDYVLCGDKLKCGKPNPQILRRIMQRFSLKPAQTLYVGDMDIDAQAARRAGAKAVIVTGGSSARSQILKERPYRLITRLGQLRRIL